MKRTLLIPLIVLILASMACGLGNAANPTAAPAESNKPSAEGENATQPAAPGEGAAAEEEAAPKIVLATETVAPTNTPSGSVTFSDTFDESNDDWSDPIIVTSQASGHEPYVQVTSGEGVMRFAISDKETYVYKLFLRAMEGDTTVETDFQNKGAGNTGIAIVCKANKELNSWYELRVSAADNNYVFYKYDKKRKDEEGKNPYVQLDRGHMKLDEYYPSKPNHIAFTCSDNELAVDVNNGKKQASFALDNPLEGNIIGLGVLSSDTVPATVDYETVIIR